MSSKYSLSHRVLLALAGGAAFIAMADGCVLDRSGNPETTGPTSNSSNGSGGAAVGSGGAGGGSSSSAMGGSGGDPCGGCSDEDCIDGVCCDTTACDGLCEACNVAGSVGTCTAVPAGQSDEDTCEPGVSTAAGEVCDGYGHCLSGTPTQHIEMGDAGDEQVAWSIATRTPPASGLLVAGWFEGTLNGAAANPDGVGAYALLINSQLGNITWTVTLDGSEGDNAYDIVADGNNRAIVSGQFGAEIDAPDTTLTAIGGTDGFQSQLDVGGGEVWAYSTMDPGPAIIVAAVIAENGKIVSFGDFDANTADNIDARITSRAPTGGVPQWQLLVSGVGQQHANDVAIMGTRIAAVGWYDGQILFGGANETATVGNKNGFVAFANDVGTAATLVTVVGDNNADDSAEGVTFDEAGNVLVVGRFSGTVDFDGTGGLDPITAAGLEDMFVLKLDINGAFLNVATFGGSDIDRLYDVEVDSVGNIVLVGSTKSNNLQVGGTALASNGDFDAVIIKLNPELEVVWAQSFGGAGEDAFIDATIDTANSIYVAGYLSSLINFGAESTTFYGEKDAFIGKFLP